MKELTQLFKLLSDETRLWILLHLWQRDELHVRGLCDLLRQSQPAVSHHLALMREAGLITLRRSGKHNYYRLCGDRLHLWGTHVLDLLPEGRKREALTRQVADLFSGSPVACVEPDVVATTADWTTSATSNADGELDDASTRAAVE